MKLGDIIKDCGIISIDGDAGIGITSLTNDSRQVTRGSLFVAVNGCGNDGRAYIPQAVKSGAAAIMCEEEEELREKRESDNGAEGPVRIIVKDSRYAVAIAADRFYGHPSGELQLIGITGTNGKTTTVTLLYNMFRSLGYECGLLSTIANYVGPEMSETANTTSDPVTINRLLREMSDAGCEYCFMEVSSIGMAEERTAGLRFKVGIFSNLTHDHLDYHGTFGEYLRCKKLFFDNLPADAYAITNIDDRNGEVMMQNTKAEVITYSCHSAADHNCRILEESIEGMLLKIDGVETWTRLIGAHNAYNILAIYCAAIALGVPKDEALLAISKLESAKGRLEIIRGPRDTSVVIDYAHTPDALQNVLKTLRDIAPQRRLICLFGCGGDRDKSKRPEMAAIAEKLADRIIITSDNSRTEKTEDIMDEISAGLSPQGRGKAVRIADRREAIRAAITLAPEGSTILLAGKGHETYQILGKVKSHFDEREIIDETFKTIG